MRSSRTATSARPPFPTLWSIGAGQHPDLVRAFGSHLFAPRVAHSNSCLPIMLKSSLECLAPPIDFSTGPWALHADQMPALRKGADRGYTTAAMGREKILPLD